MGFLLRFKTTVTQSNALFNFKLDLALNFALNLSFEFAFRLAFELRQVRAHMAATAMTINAPNACGFSESAHQFGTRGRSWQFEKTPKPMFFIPIPLWHA